MNNKNKKNSKNYYSPNHIFLTGGEKAGLVLGGIGNALYSGILASQINDMSHTENLIEQIRNTDFNAGDNTSLMQLWTNAKNLNVDLVTFEDVYGSHKDRALQGLAGITSGLSTALTGNWIGGLVNAGASIIGTNIGSLIAERKAKEKVAELNRANLTAVQLRSLNFNYAVDTLEDLNMFNFLSNYAADGGPLFTNGGIWSNGLTFINNGGSHELNPYEGVLMGIAPDGKPNLVEEGEVIYNDYVFSRRLKVPKKDYAMLGLKGKKIYSYADAAEILQKESKERPNDPISKKNMEALFNRLQLSQETYKQERDAKKMQQTFASLSPEEQNYLMLAMEYPSQLLPIQYATGGRLFAGESLDFTSPDTEYWTNAEINRKFKTGKDNGIHVHISDYIKAINAVLEELNKGRGMLDSDYDVDLDAYIKEGYTNLDAIQELYDAYQTFTTKEQYVDLFKTLENRLGKKFSFNSDFEFDINKFKNNIAVKNLLEQAINESLAEDLYTKEYSSKLIDLEKKAKNEGRKPTEDEYNQIRESAINAFLDYKYKYNKDDNTDRSTGITLKEGKITGGENNPFWYYANKIAWSKPDYYDSEFPEIFVTAKRKEDNTKKTSDQPEPELKPTSKLGEEPTIFSTSKKEEGKGNAKLDKEEPEIEEEVIPEGIKVGPTIGSVSPFDIPFVNPFTDPFKSNPYYNWWENNWWKPVTKSEQPDPTIKKEDEIESLDPKIKSKVDKDMKVKKEEPEINKTKYTNLGMPEGLYPGLRTNRAMLIGLGITPKPLSLGIQSSTVLSLADTILSLNNNTSNNNILSSILRYTPVAIQGITALTDALGITNKPDYSNPNLIANNTLKIAYKPVGNYLTYKPFDINYAANKLANLAAANRRAALDLSGGNRGTAMANLLATDLNAQTALGDTYVKSWLANREQELKVEDFNRNTNMANSQMGLTADLANLRTALESAVQLAAMRELIDKYISEAKSNNLNTFLDNLQGIGREMDATREAKKTAAALAAYGGKLKRKKKKGLTC